MNKLTFLLLVIIMALSFNLILTRQGKAQDKSYTGVVPFVTNNDRVGFLDQKNGRIYIYDSNVSNCLFVGQIDNLGQPIKAVTATSDKTTENTTTNEQE